MSGDLFLKLDEVQGETTDATHQNEIQLLAFGFGVTNHGAGAYGKGSGAARSDVSDVQITKRVDASSPELFKRCATGKTVGNAVLTARKAGGDAPVEYEVWKLTEVFISSFSNNVADGGDVATETLSLNFSKLEFNYTVQNADGTAGSTTTTSYDIKENKAS